MGGLEEVGGALGTVVVTPLLLGGRRVVDVIEPKQSIIFKVMYTDLKSLESES